MKPNICAVLGFVTSTQPTQVIESTILKRYSGFQYEVQGCGGGAPMQGWNPCTPRLTTTKSAVKAIAMF
jgi:hypothetical protein